MSAFYDNNVTDKGRLIMAEIQMGAELVMTRIVIGAGLLPQGKTTRTITDVVEPIKSINISKKQKMTEGSCVFGGTFTNKDITEAFFFRELALYAKAVYTDGEETSEILYSYGNAGGNAELIPAYSTGTIVERQLDLIVYVGNDVTVNLEIESEMYASKKELKDLDDSKEPCLNSAAVKSSLVDGDNLPILDSADSNKTKRLSFASLKTVLKAYFDTLYNKYTHPAYTARSAGLYKVTVDKTGHVSAAVAVAKADITGLGIPAQDTVYVHPNDLNTRHVSDTEKTTWNGKASTAAVTTTTNGLAIASDKVKLDGIAVGANKTVVANNLTTTVAGSALDASQGKKLNDGITQVNNSLGEEITTRANADTELQNAINSKASAVHAHEAENVEISNTVRDLYGLTADTANVEKALERGWKREETIEITSSQIYTFPYKCTADVFAVGGGGGGGGQPAFWNSGGNGGGGGGYIGELKNIPFNLGQTVNITIGQGGLGGNGSEALIIPGADGGNSIFGILEVKGGKGGGRAGTGSGDYGGDGTSGGGSNSGNGGIYGSNGGGSKGGKGIITPINSAIGPDGNVYGSGGGGSGNGIAGINAGNGGANATGDAYTRVPGTPGMNAAANRGGGGGAGGAGLNLGSPGQIFGARGGNGGSGIVILKLRRV